MRQPGSALHLANDRIESAVRMQRGAEVAQTHVRFRSEALKQRRREPRLANARFPGEEHHLAFAGLCF